MKNRSREPDVWSEFQEEDQEEALEQVLEEYGIKSLDSYFSDLRHLEVSIQKHFVEIDAQGRRVYVVLDEETGFEYRETIPGLREVH